MSAALINHIPILYVGYRVSVIFLVNMAIFFRRVIYGFNSICVRVTPIVKLLFSEVSEKYFYKMLILTKKNHFIGSLFVF